MVEPRHVMHDRKLRLWSYGKKDFHSSVRMIIKKNQHLFFFIGSDAGKISIFQVVNAYRISSICSFK